jgi:hypothetical protein
MNTQRSFVKDAYCGIFIGTLDHLAGCAFVVEG